jgi:hypothetical protein
VSRLLADALAGRGKPKTAPAFRWRSRAMGALVDLADKEALYALLDQPDRAAEP